MTFWFVLHFFSILYDPYIFRKIARPISTHISFLQLIFNRLLKDFIYLFLDRGEMREKERERNINVWLPLTWPPLGAWPATQCVPWLGIEPETLLFAAHDQSTGPHQPGPNDEFCLLLNLMSTVSPSTYSSCLGSLPQPNVGRIHTHGAELLFASSTV